MLSLPVVLVAAWFGHYSPPVTGAFGWILTACIGRRTTSSVVRHWSRLDSILLVTLLLLSAWHGFYRNESIFAGRDEGVYSNHAVHLARTGALRAEPTFRDLHQGANAELASGIQAGGYFFNFEQQNIYFQFPPTFALTLATAFGAGSFTGLFLLNPLLAALNTGLFFEFSQYLLRRRWAVFATACFSLNLAQVWIAHITLSEVLTQSWLLVGLILLHHSLQHKNYRLGMMAHALVAACTFVRIDAYLVLLGLCCFDA